MIMRDVAMADFIKLWLAAAVIFLAVDMVWLTWLGKPFYVAEIGTMLREKPLLPAAIAFYAVYITCLLILVVVPAFKAGSVSQALLYGAVFGLAAYGTYDLTNLAVLKGFTTRIALIDLAWGTALTAGVSAATVALGSLWRG
jgi:uncharacterized membrane protein